MRITALAGGVGGAKLVQGLSMLLSPEELSVIVNTGDDFEHMGLWVTPDLDTVCHTLANLADPARGWGRKEDSWNALAEFQKFNLQHWFQLGDKDLATNIYRTFLLKSGYPLSEVVKKICECWGVKYPIFPMTNDIVQTKIISKEYGEIGFQDYYVKFGCSPQVLSIKFNSAKTANPPWEVPDLITKSDLVIICPSNPLVSIDPILSIRKIREALEGKKVIAISPIIQGQAVKGPLQKMLIELNLPASTKTIARHYGSLITAFVLDSRDIEEKEEIERWGIIPFATNIIMNNLSAKKLLAENVLELGSLITGSV